MKNLLKLTKEKELNENIIKKRLKHYNLKDALCFLGRTSRYIENNDLNHTPLYINQFQLLFWANMFLISGSGDYKNDYISQGKENALKILGSVYLENLPEPFLEDNNLQSFMMRMNFEQFELQQNIGYIIARNYCFFNVLKDNNKALIDELEQKFYQKTNLSLSKYLRIAYYVSSSKKILLSEKNFYNNFSSKIDKTISEEDISNFFNILKINYNDFRTEDKKETLELESKNLKTKPNILKRYPIIELKKKGGNDYVIPNWKTFILRAFNVFEWFYDNYETEFTDKYFGKIFEEYVGLILKNIFGENNTTKGFFYAGKQGRTEFFDWIVEDKNDIYLFEVKSRKSHFLSTVTGKTWLERKKIIDAITQVNKRMKDLHSNLYPELQKFHGKNVIPIIVFYDIPFISGDLLNDLLTNDLNNKGINNIKINDYNIINIDELEAYDDVKDKISLKDIFQQLQTDSGLGNSFVYKLFQIKNKKELKNKYLESIVEKYFDDIDENINR